jgi:hypothetical protein
MVTHRQNNRGSDGSGVFYLVRFVLYKKDQWQKKRKEKKNSTDRD